MPANRQHLHTKSIIRQHGNDPLANRRQPQVGARRAQAARNKEPDIPVMDKALKCMEIITCLRSGEVVLFLLHVTPSESNGSDTQTCLGSHPPALPLLILDMNGESLSAPLAFDAAPYACLNEDGKREILRRAVRMVAVDGGCSGPRSDKRPAFGTLRIDISNCADHSVLTERELQIMRLLAEGVGIGNIASRLAIGNRTVSTCKTRLMRKMGFASIAHLVRYAIAHKLA